jgi:CheY-like chemotaxis protein
METLPPLRAGEELLRVLRAHGTAPGSRCFPDYWYAEPPNRMMIRVLWADDEIDLLRPHILFLEGKGYEVTTVTNGSDAVEKARQVRFDLIFLDEQMPGLGGLETLAEIKGIAPETPVVMITKSEEEHLMEDAIGGQIADYLIKPVNPKQILLTCKRLLEGGRLREEKASQEYLRRFGELSSRIGGGLDHQEWIEVYQELVRYGLDLDADVGARQILEDQYRDANREFGRYIEDVYPGWIAAAKKGEKEGRPRLSSDVLSHWVMPHLGKQRPVVFFLVDCMRYDQWLEFERLLYPLFNVEKDWHYSLLPTATPYSRNAIFAGLLPIDIATRHPQYWQHDDGNEGSLNQHEAALLDEFLKRRHAGEVRHRYQKIVSTEDGQALAAATSDLLQHELSAIVVNFVDILAHSRSDSNVLKEIAPDERAYRALTRTWFEHSWLYRVLEELASEDATVVITTDHGVVRSLHPTKVIGDRETSTSLRYKHGRNLKADEKSAIIVRNPEVFGLPKTGINENYIFAKEDYYFVYPTNYNRYLNQYMDTFQHGGASLEEMILPVATLTPR